MWFIEDLARYESETQCACDLDREAEWLDNVVWLIDASEVYIECDLQVGDRQFPIRVKFPPGYPASPPAVLPRNKEHWSSHQYGIGGDLCLELGPDNWHPDQHNVADILRSAEKLLRLEQDHDTNPDIPSRHETTVGQDVRGQALRFAMTDATRSFLAALKPADQVTGTVLFRFHRTSFTTFLVRADVNDERWEDPNIPSNAINVVGFEQSLVVSPQRHNAKKWLALQSHDGLKAILQGRLSESDEEDLPKFVLVCDSKETWTLFRFQDDGSAPARYVTVTIDTLDAQNRTGLSSHQLDECCVAIIGLGSMGSRVALSLARSGVRRFLLIDDDLLQPVNLVRHDADWNAVGMHKVDYIAERIRSLRPGIEVIVRKHRLGGQEAASSTGTAIRSLMESDLIIDATANPSVFNLAAQVSRRSKTAMIWMETFAGGIGGLIARARPDVDADPFTLRSTLNAYCEDHPDPSARTQGYGVEVGDDEWMVATDAEVSVIALHAAQLCLDTLLRKEPSEFDDPMYLIGLRREWVFTAPFHTIPLECQDAGQWGVNPIDPSRAPDVLALIKQSLGNAAARNADPQT